MKNITTILGLTLMLSASFVSETYAQETGAQAIVSEDSVQENRRRARVQGRSTRRAAPSRARTAPQRARTASRRAARTAPAPRRHYTPGRVHPARRVVRHGGYRHRPHRHTYSPSRRYSRSAYRSYVRSLNPSYFYFNWVLYPTSRVNGYFVINGYPYYVYNGYQHRYSYNDYCDYQLVDSYTDSVYQYFDNQMCAVAYDRCAIERDRQNNYERDERFFCAEVFDSRY